MTHGPMKIVVSSINHDAHSLLTPIKDRLDDAFQAYGSLSLKNSEISRSRVLDYMRVVENHISYLIDQMSNLGKLFDLNHDPHMALEFVKGAIRPAAAKLLHQSEELLTEAHMFGLTSDTYHFQNLHCSCEELNTYIMKICDIGQKILSNRDQRVVLETEFQKALQHVRQKYLNVEVSRTGHKLSRTIKANRGTVYMMFKEIISNAFKYRSNERALIIDKYQWTDEQSIVIGIGDNGIGIEEKYCVSDIFRTGFRVPYSESSDELLVRPPGQGIGLSIVKSITDYLSATIRVTSELGTGTRFYLTLAKS